MKVKPLYSYNAGVLTDAEGSAIVSSPARLRIEDFSAGVAEADVSALAAKGANLILFCVALDTIMPAPDSFNEAALARLREVLKKAEEKRVAAVLAIESRSEGAANELFISAAEHAARRLKDCASLIGFAAPQEADEGFLLQIEARLKKKHPTQLIFIPPRGNGNACGDEAQGIKGEKLQRLPFVSQEFYPQVWL